MNIRIEFTDAAVVSFVWTNDAPDGEFVFATFTEAKAAALAATIPSRDAFIRCVRLIRSATRNDIQPPR